MSVKNFKFVSPGVFINEIDNSFIPKTPDAIGPVVIGRSRKGLAMQPIKIEAYSDFVNQFGDTVPGNAGGDVYREGNLQSPMYGTYAAKAFLNAGVAPLTYIRLLGQQSTENNGKPAAKAGWQTIPTPVAGGGAYGLFLIKSSSVTGNHQGNLGSMECAAIWYLNNGTIRLSGTVWGMDPAYTTASAGAVILSDSQGVFKMAINGAAQGEQTFTFNFDDNSQKFIRQQFSTNPQLAGSGSYYPTSAEIDYWLGETFEQNVRDAGAVGSQCLGIVLALGSGSVGAPTVGPAKMKGQESREGVAGWFIGQDTGIATSYRPQNMQKLFRLQGRGHGEWLQKHVKVSIENIRQSNTTVTEYGTFSVVLRNINDTDNNIEVIERFDNCTLNPTDPSFIARKIGDKFNKWDNTNRVLREYGEYPNQSRFVYVEMNADVEAGATEDALLPFGYFGPPKYAGHSVGANTGSKVYTMVKYSGSYAGFAQPRASYQLRISGGVNAATANGGSGVAGATSSLGKAFLSASSWLALTSSNGTAKKYRFIGGFLKTPGTASNGDICEGGTSIAVFTGSAHCTTLKFLQAAVTGANGHNGLIDVRLHGTSGDLSATGLTASFYQAVGGKAGVKPVISSSLGKAGKCDGRAWTSEVNKNFRSDPPTFSLSAVAAHGMRATGLLGGRRSDLQPDFTASMTFPNVPLRASASDGGLTNPTDAFWGMRTTRTADSTQNSYGTFDCHRLLYSGFPDDPTSGADAAGRGVKEYAYVFSLDDIRRTSTTGSYYYESGSRRSDNSVTAASGSYTTLLDKGYNKFTAPIWGGFDGWDIMKPDPAANSLMAAASTEDNDYVYNTYRQALETVADPDLLDFNLLATPGLTNNSLTRYSIQLCEDRADAMALIDLENVYTPSHETYKTRENRAGRNVNNIANNLRDRRIDSSYGATFYPWVQTRDAATGQLVWIPPTVAMMGVLASAESKAAVWFAPAGFNRGGLSDGAAGIPITNVTSRLSSKDRDILYEARINPIASFPSSGIVVFGQKTLQERQSALDRINVRRLVIYLKKQISILSTQILFEQNVEATWDRFKALIEPFLANVKTRFGITEYRLILDSSTTTPDLIDQNILYAKIMIKPARAIEFIAIDFVIASTGASFDD